MYGRTSIRFAREFGLSWRMTIHSCLEAMVLAVDVKVRVRRESLVEERRRAEVMGG